MTIKINFKFEEWFNYNNKLIQDLKERIFGKENETSECEAERK